MRHLFRGLLSAHHLESRRSELCLFIATAAFLELASGVGLAYVAGFGAVRQALGDFQWRWLMIAAGFLLISFAGYFWAYRGIARVEGGPTLPARQLHAVVAAGFSGFLARSGTALDKVALQAAGAGEEEASVRVTGLAALEQGVLSLGGCGAAIAVLAAELHQPPASATIPWAVIPVPGLLIGFWAAQRYRHRFRGRAGWRRMLWILLESLHIIRELFVHPLRWGPAVLGMAVFWTADACALWSGLAAFGFRMNPAALFVGFASGMVFTRRTGPLAGAGVLGLVLPVTIWYSGAPFAVAVVGVFAYRGLSLWLPMPVALATLPALRKMGARRPLLAAAQAEARPRCHARSLRRQRPRRDAA